MTDRPIIFGGPMVRALIEGRKKQTRPAAARRGAIAASHGRGPSIQCPYTAAPPPYLDAYCGAERTAANPCCLRGIWCWWTRDDRAGQTFRVPYLPGGRLWVREAFAESTFNEFSMEKRYRCEPREDEDGFDDGLLPPTPPTVVQYRAASDEWPECTARWSPSIHMPRRLSRPTLIVEAVRVRRLQDISDEDARAEGAPFLGAFRAGFASLWEALHGAGAWERNPYVAAITFRVVQANVDLPAAAERELEHV